VHSAAEFSRKIRLFFSFERIFILIFLLTIVLRFWQLDLKLFHHDEAIHSWFSYELLKTGAWEYDPSYHGPFLYYVTAGMFSLFGDSDLVARLLPSLFGSMLIPLVYCIYRLGYIDKKQTLFASLFLAISPDMVYFSRFLRHDIFMLFFSFLFLVAILYYLEYGKTRFAVIGAIAMAGGLCCKEEMPIIILIFASFFLFAIWQKKFRLPTGWKYDCILSVFIVFGIMSVLYSAFGFHLETLIGQNFALNTTGWYKAVAHWVEMHNQQRLGGPWFFYIPLFLLYELPIFILGIIGTLQFLLHGFNPSLFIHRLRVRITYFGSVIPTSELAALNLQQLKTRKPEPAKSDIFFRFCIYWMILIMAFYAIVGEKVPWLIIPQLLPMCLIAVYKLNWQKMVFAIIGCIFLIVITWHVAFIPADINEPIVQVQNSEDLRDVMKLMDASDHVVVASQNYWPLPWYYRGDRWEKIKFYGDIVDEATLTQDNPGVIILHDTASYPFIQGYDKKTYKLAYWFSWYDNENRLFDYYFHRDGTMGSINIDVFTP
jgi:uncharacterized protein (TIGR03663 family)